MHRSARFGLSEPIPWARFGLAAAVLSCPNGKGGHWGTGRREKPLPARLGETFRPR
jgi:hypothetical protein